MIAFGRNKQPLSYARKSGSKIITEKNMALVLRAGYMLPYPDKLALHLNQQVFSQNSLCQFMSSDPVYLYRNNTKLTSFGELNAFNNLITIDTANRAWRIKGDNMLNLRLPASFNWNTGAIIAFTVKIDGMTDWEDLLRIPALNNLRLEKNTNDAIVCYPNTVGSISLSFGQTDWATFWIELSPDGWVVISVGGVELIEGSLEITEPDNKNIFVGSRRDSKAGGTYNFRSFYAWNVKPDGTSGIDDSINFNNHQTYGYLFPYIVDNGYY